MSSIIREMPFGALTLAFTTDVEFRWSSQGTGGKYPGGFYHPKPPAGFFALGTVARASKRDDGNFAALCVKPTDPNRTDLLAHPTGYERIWKSEGTGGDEKGACWRPIAPEGYVALGHVFTTSHKTAPALSDVVCVRKMDGTDALVHKGKVGTSGITDGGAIYDTSGTGADHHLSAWAVAAPASDGDEKGLIAAQTFIGKQGRGAPTDDDALWVLNLPFPSERFESPALPELSGYAKPADYTGEIDDALVYVPFTGIVDNDPIGGTGETKISAGWQVENSPFYTVRRSARYHLVSFLNNTTQQVQTSPPETHTIGVNQETSQTFSVETGITVGYGIKVGGPIVEESLSVQVSLKLGFSQTVSHGGFAEQSITYSISVAPRTAGALYEASYMLQAVRADGTRVGSPLAFDLKESHYATQYPPAPSRSLQGVSVAMAEPQTEAEPVPA